MKKALYIILFTLILPISSFAWDYSPPLNRGFHAGVRLSAGYSYITGLNTAKKYGLPDVNYKVGNNFNANYAFTWDLGFALQYTAPKNKYLQMDMLVFSDGGAIVKDVNKDSDHDIGSINMLSMQIKLFAGKKFTLSNSIQFFIGAGPYYAHLFPGYGGSADIYYKEYYDEENDEYYEESYIGKGDSPRTRKNEIGLNIHFGIEYKNTQIGFGFDHGITKIFKDPHFDSRNMSFKFTITHFPF